MDDAKDLIERLCTVAGIILEDVHEVAIAGVTNTSGLSRIAAIDAAASDVLALARAAAIISSRFGE